MILPEFIRYHIDTEGEHKGVAYYLVGAVISKTDSVGGDKCTCHVRINGGEISLSFCLLVLVLTTIQCKGTGYRQKRV